MPEHYPFITITTLRLAIAVLFLQRRSIHADAQSLVKNLRHPFEVSGKEYIPHTGPSLITVNHYNLDHFPSWWTVVSVNAAVPVDIHWIMAEAWVFPDQPLKDHTIAPLTRWAFRRITHVYGFTRMPPMPPNPREVAARARAVREVLDVARRASNPVIGMAPEGGDITTGALQPPPPGVGRFINHLAQLGLEITPAGVYESGNTLHVNFGPPYRLCLPPNLSKDAIDSRAGRIVMNAISSLLPPELRGMFSV